ncbi:MAG: beta-galactosidase [Lachnospiraceae bacterium]|nr:beta-galactosidase [Lachnospiraceae bacterium]
MVYGFSEHKEKPVKTGHLHMGGANPSGERIDVTSLYFTRGDKPVIDVMGEYHFSRDKRENWYRELCKMKAGGVTIVATYLFWIYHEEVEGETDFTGDLDIRYFTEQAARAGLFVILRIGPFAHGECRNGGFPDWLLKKDFPLRDNNDGYMAQVRKWYGRIFTEVKGLLYRDGGPVIGIQLENELTDNAEHLLSLKKLAVSLGFEVPLYTVTGWNAARGARIPVSEVVPVFAAYADAPWEEGTKELPPSWHYVFSDVRNDAAVGKDILSADSASADDWILPYDDYPYATCEMGAGLPFTHHRRPVISGMDAYALALVKLGCGNNLAGYYMYHGGTHRIGKLSTFNETKASGFPNDYAILNYDFHTALTQYGRAREQYGLLNLLHLFTADFGQELAKMTYTASAEPVRPEDTGRLRYAMRTDGQSGYVFINNYARRLPLPMRKDVVIDTGTVTFPSVDIRENISFFMPFHLKLKDGTVLACATAQPLCYADNACFFMEIPGIEPQFILEDGRILHGETPGGLKIVTLPMSEAVYARKLSGKLLIGENVNLYEAEGRICAIEDGPFSYRRFCGDHFEEITVTGDFHPATLSVTDCDEPFAPPYPEELMIGGPRRLTWKKLRVDTDEGMVRITYRGDVAQIYAGNELAADEFYCGEPWMIPASLLYGRDCYLVYSQLLDDCYLEE